MEDRPDAEIDRNARFTLEEAAFLAHSLWSLPERVPLPLVDEVRLPLDTSPAAEGPEQYWGFERDNLLRKLARLTPFQQQAIRDAVDVRRQSLPPDDLARVQAILDNWVRLKSEHDQREFLRARLRAIGLPLES
ncbi:MAG TPA: hypothetical protein VFI42_02985 [Thermomicrobiaceae bacterium]|nr:hypothetical protein [Thermomicrobiaceae bacterium]